MAFTSIYELKLFIYLYMETRFRRVTHNMENNDTSKYDRYILLLSFDLVVFFFICIQSFLINSSK